MYKKENHYDCLIIGQGLAGSILSYQLIKQGKTCLIINKHNPKAASYIAGGIFSPIAGQRIAKIWQADEIYPNVINFYLKLQKELNSSFFHQLPYIKLLINENLKKYAERRFNEPTYEAFIKKIKYKIKNGPVDAIEIQNTGWMNTSVFLDTYRQFLKAHSAYLEHWFDEKELKVHDKLIEYKQVTANNLIFANGLQATHNRFFKQIKLNPIKGELLTVKMNLSTYAILNGNVFVLPIGNNLFHIGATFERFFSDALPSELGKAKLCSELEKLIDVPYEIIDHKAGIRPTTFGHRPLIEQHKDHSNVFIFSGFGAKGVSYIPHCAEQLINLIS